MKDESIGESGSMLVVDEDETTKKLKQKRSGWWGWRLLSGLSSRFFLLDRMTDSGAESQTVPAWSLP